MATAQVQEVMAAAPVHDNGRVKEEEKKHEIIQDPPRAKVVEEKASDTKVQNNGDSKDEEVPASDADEGQRIAKEVEAKLAVQPAEAEAKETKEGRPGRGAKKATAEKAAAKGAVVPVDDEIDAPEGANKKTEKAAAKWAVVPVDDETDDEVVAPAGDQAPVAAPVASEEEAEADGEEATKGGKEEACEEKAHEA